MPKQEGTHVWKAWCTSAPPPKTPIGRETSSVRRAAPWTLFGDRGGGRGAVRGVWHVLLAEVLRPASQWCRCRSQGDTAQSSVLIEIYNVYTASHRSFLSTNTSLIINSSKERTLHERMPNSYKLVSFFTKYDASLFTISFIENVDLPCGILRGSPGIR